MKLKLKNFRKESLLKHGILVKTLVNDRTNFEAVRFFQEISERQNQDFDEVINMLLTARDLVGINLS